MRHRMLLIIWLLSDLLLFLGAYALAYFLRVGWIFSTDFPFSRHMASAALVAPVWLMVLATTRTFHITRNQITLRNIAYISYAALVGAALFTLVYYFRYTTFFSRLLLVEAFVLSAAFTLLWHALFEQIQRSMLRRDPPAFPTLIIGVTRESRRLLEALQQQRNPLKPVAVLDGHGTAESCIAGVPVLGKLNKLEEVLSQKKITHLIQCADLEQSLNLLSACRSHGITYMLLPSVLGIVERDERVESLEGNPVTVVSPARPWWRWFF
jgi:FlaA1/EpsC-like NDP-sugar epimerase